MSTWQEDAREAAVTVGFVLLASLVCLAAVGAVTGLGLLVYQAWGFWPAIAYSAVATLAALWLWAFAVMRAFS